MDCKVDGCTREARYIGAQLCQMHYFRQRRYGTTDTVKRGHAKERLESPAGYQWIYSPKHPLGGHNGYVYEHRAVLYAALGDGPLVCALCGASLFWANCHVDHIDEDVRNNAVTNLRPTCRTCNTRRGMRPAAEWNHTVALEYAGERKTAAEWARDPRVNVAGKTILARKRSGMSDADALFAPKRTHKWTKDELRQIAAHYKAKKKELEQHGD